MSIMLGNVEDVKNQLIASGYRVINYGHPQRFPGDPVGYILRTTAPGPGYEISIKGWPRVPFCQTETQEITNPYPPSGGVTPVIRTLTLEAITPMGRGGPAPQNVTAVPQGGNIYVSWDPLYGAVHYVVYRNVSPDLATAAVIANPVQTSYTDTSVIPGQTYYYWVAASPGANYPDSDATGPVAATVQLPPPENLTALAGDADIYVSWNAVTDAASYVLYRNLSPDLSTALLLANPTGTSYTDTDVLAGHTYYYWVAARNEAGDSDAIGPATATLPEAVPEPIPEPLPEPIPIPTPPEEGFAPGDNIRRIMDIVHKRLDEIQKDKAAGKWPPWGWP